VVFSVSKKVDVVIFNTINIGVKIKVIETGEREHRAIWGFALHQERDLFYF
jgi:hypothetical protein